MGFYMAKSNKGSTTKLSTIQRVFLYSLIGSLGVAALVAIIMFLFGKFGSVELKTLATTLFVSAYSIISLGSLAVYSRKQYRPVALSGVALSVVAFAMTMFLIWGGEMGLEYWRVATVTGILAFSTAHSSLLLLARSKDTVVNTFVTATIFFVAIVASMMIYSELSGWGSVGETFYRFLGVAVVFDVLGTIVTPILKKVRS